MKMGHGSGFRDHLIRLVHAVIVRLQTHTTTQLGVVNRQCEMRDNPAGNQIRSN